MSEETQVSKSSKMNQAIAKARDQEMVPAAAPDPSRQLVVPNGFEGLVGRSQEAEIIADVTERGWEMSPQLFTIEEGTWIEGILEGNGVPTEFTDNRSGEVREVQTWIIRHPRSNARISILSSAQLDRKLPLFEGGPVKIYRCGKIKLSNAPGYCTNYIVTGPRMKVIDVKAAS